jgi:hypothetical protein
VAIHYLHSAPHRLVQLRLRVSLGAGEDSLAGAGDVEPVAVSAGGFGGEALRSTGGSAEEAAEVRRPGPMYGPGT